MQKINRKKNNMASLRLKHIINKKWSFSLGFSLLFLIPILIIGLNFSNPKANQTSVINNRNTLEPEEYGLSMQSGENWVTLPWQVVWTNPDGYYSYITNQTEIVKKDDLTNKQKLDNNFNYEKMFSILKEKTDIDDDGLSEELSNLISSTDISVSINSGYKIIDNSIEKTQIICTFLDAPSLELLKIITDYGINIDKIWTDAIYGFSATLSTSQILTLKNILDEQGLSGGYYIEKSQRRDAQMYVAAKQMNVRPYIWDTLGYKGDNNSTIAVIDTGIDDSHPNHYGYADQDFTEKIVGWYDATDLASTSPIDDGSHGSHCAGIAAGSGFETTDASGRIAYSDPILYNLTGNSYSIGTYYASAASFNVTSTGTIKIEADFIDKTTTTGSYVYGGFALFYNDGTNVVEEDYNTNSSWTDHSITYTVDASHLGLYTIKMKLYFGSTGTSCQDPVFTYAFSWWAPYNSPTDGYKLWTGVAPDTKLMGIKVLTKEGSGSSAGILDGINYAVANKETYHLTILSMSFGGSAFTLSEHLAVERAVNNGLVSIVAAGNDGPSANNVGQPGNADSIISVAALTFEDNVTSYSSRGGNSYTGNTIKPDIAAPGGSFSFPIYSTDSNDQDELYFSDQYANDSRNMQGTSMATPAVAGAASLLIDAMGGYSNWNYSRDEVLAVKNLLLLTATETNRLREDDVSYHSPVLNRGEKDIDEGYGRINVYAAISAATTSAQLGQIYQGNLYSSTANVYEPHAWARNIKLTKGTTYEFKLGMDNTLDCDLYVYSSTPTEYGDPIIEASLIDEGVSNGTLHFTPEETAIYYIVVKAVTGSGSFTLDLSDTTISDFAAVWVSPFEGTTTTRTITARVLDQSSITVWAAIEHYNGYYSDISGNKNSGEVIETVQLFDDGTHGDPSNGDGNFTNTIDTSYYKMGKYRIDIIVYDANLGENMTYYSLAGGFWVGSDTESPNVIVAGSDPDTVFSGDIVNFNAAIYDTSGISSASVKLYTISGTLVDTITLYDDGNHEDYLINDGIFGATYDTSSLTPQTYYYTIEATDNSATSNQVITDKLGYFNVTETPDNSISENYDIIVNATYNWISASTAMTSLTDDETATITLSGWSFPFYNSTYSTINVNMNGFLSLQTSTFTNPYKNPKFPSSQTSGPDARKTIAPLWTDLIDGTGGVYYTQGADYLVIEWYNVQYYGGYAIGSFEVILYANGTIKFQYNNLNQNAFSVQPTCGINYGEYSNLATNFYQLDQAIGTTSAVVFHYATPLDENQPSIGVILPLEDEKLYGNKFKIGTYFSDEQLDTFRYRIYSYSNTSYVSDGTWFSDTPWFNLELGQYKLEIEANDTAGNQLTKEYNFTMIGNLTTSMLSAEAINTNSIKTTWTSAPDVTEYLLYRDTQEITPDRLDSLTPYQKISSGTTEYIDSSITFDTTYYYAVIGNNSYGTSWLWGCMSASVTDHFPSASFSTNSTHIIAGQSIQFTDTSTSLGNAPTTYQWDFGDGSPNDTIINPEHTYSSAGIFTAILTLQDTDGDISVYSVEISVDVDTIPIANFTINSSSIVAGEYVQFTDTSSGISNTPINYQWNFGDGSANSTEQNPIHQYITTGTFTATLTVQDLDGDISTTSIIINVAIDTQPAASFSVNYTSIIEGQSIQFTDTSSSLGNAPTTYQWNFGDGSANSTEQNPIHQYTTSGTYIATLALQDVDGDISVYSLTITIVSDILPVASFTQNSTAIVPNDWVLFTDTSSSLGNTPTTYQWNFGDGSANSTEQNPIHQFSAIGSYTITLSLIDSNGDISVFSREIIVASDIQPNASFLVNSSIIIEGQFIQFNDSSSTLGNLPTTYQWNFGDGSPNSTKQNPIHQYLTAGTYIAILTLQDNDGDLSIYSMKIIVNVDDKPTASFSLNATIISVGSSIQFIDTSSNLNNTPILYQWNFGDGSANSTEQNPIHQYTTAGNYTIILTISDSNGDVSISSYTITVKNEITSDTNTDSSTDSSSSSTDEENQNSSPSTTSTSSNNTQEENVHSNPSNQLITYLIGFAALVGLFSIIIIKKKANDRA